MAEKTGNELECEKIAAMSMRELLDYVLGNPEYLTDSYYRVFGSAVYKRDEQLTAEVHLSDMDTSGIPMGTSDGSEFVTDFEAAGLVQSNAVHVVMGNDFPSAVFSTEALAEAYCKRMGGANADPRGPQPQRRIYWRHYKFELDKDKEK